MYEKLLAKSKTELYNINKIISKHNCWINNSNCYNTIKNNN